MYHLIWATPSFIHIYEDETKIIIYRFPSLLSYEKKTREENQSYISQTTENLPFTISFIIFPHPLQIPQYHLLDHHHGPSYLNKTIKRVSHRLDLSSSGEIEVEEKRNEAALSAEKSFAPWVLFRSNQPTGCTVPSTYPGIHPYRHPIRPSIHSYIQTYIHTYGTYIHTIHT